LPAAVKLPGFLSPSHCRRLISLARRKGFHSIKNDRYGQASTTTACRLLPKEDELVYKQLAIRITQLNAETLAVVSGGIYEPVNVLCYRPPPGFGRISMPITESRIQAS